MLGRIVSHYRVLAELGRGGMGVVYEAEDTRLGRRVALKFLHDRLTASPTALARFAREARAASALNHPHICIVHDIDEHEGQPFLVMELLEGEPLRQRIHGASLPVHEIVALGIHVAGALEAAHAAGIVHRDLTPGNIFVTTRGDAKVLDFGIAKLQSEARAAGRLEASTVDGGAPLTGPGLVVGTPGYTSPEQALGRDVDARSDLFSLGVVLYEMAVGRRAFARDTPAAANDAVIHDTPPPAVEVNPVVPSGLAAIIEKAIEKDRELRYQSASDLRADLRRLDRELAGRVRTPAGVSPAVGSPAALSPAAGSPVGGSPAAVSPAALPPAPAHGATVAPTPESVARSAGRRSGGDHGNGTRVWRRRLMWSVAILALVTAVVAGLGLVMARNTSGLPEIETLEVTSGTGMETDPAISPDGRTIAYVSDEGGNPDIWMVDVEGGPPVRWTTNPGVDRNPAWSDDGSELYFESTRNGQTGIFRASRGSSEDAVLVVPDGRAPSGSRDGTTLACSVLVRGEGRLRIGVTDGRGINPVRILTSEDDGQYDHEDPTWSPDGKEVAYWAWDGLWVVRVADGHAVQLTKAVNEDTHPTWSSAGRFIYFTSWRRRFPQLWRVDRGSGAIEPVTTGLGRVTSPSLDRTGQVMVFSTATSGRRVVIREMDTGSEVELGGAGDQMFPALSRDGRILVYSLRAWARQDLYVQMLDDSGRPTGAQRRLASHEGVACQPTISPDGPWVAYVVVSPDNSRHVWTMPVSGAGTPRRFTEDLPQNMQPAWSPDGTRLAYAAGRERGVTQVYVQAIGDGRPASPAVRLTSATRDEQAPAWSPDSARIAFLTPGSDGTGEVAVATVAEPGVEMVTSGAGAWRMAWRPDGQSLMLTAGWGTDNLSLHAYGLVDRQVLSSVKPIALGAGAIEGSMAALFGMSGDGRRVAYVKVTREGRVGLLRTVNGRPF